MPGVTIVGSKRTVSFLKTKKYIVSVVMSITVWLFTEKEKIVKNSINIKFFILVNNSGK